MTVTAAEGPADLKPATTAAPAAEPAPGRRRLLGVIPDLLGFGGGALPIALILVRALVHAGATVRPWGDDALLELGARDLLRGRRLLGPYSRFGWHHPGPAEFFVLAGPVKLLGSGPGLLVGSSLWNLTVAVAVVAVCRHRAGPWMGAVAGLALALLTLAVGPPLFSQPWNPYVVLLPMLLLVVLAADALTSSRLVHAALRLAPDGGGEERPGGGVAAAWAVVVATFVVQTHVSTGPAAAVLTVVAVGSVVWGGRRWRGRRPDDQPGRHRRRPGPGVIVALGATAVLWALPAWEAVTRHPSNPVLILRFFTKGYPPAGLKPALKQTAAAMSALPFGFRAEVFDPHRSKATLLLGALFVVTLALLAVAASVWRRSAFGTALAGLGVVTGLVGFAANERITGGVLDYLIVWQTMVPAIFVLALGAAFLTPGQRWAPGPAPARPWRPATVVAAAALAVAVACLTTVNSRHELRQQSADHSSFAAVDAVVEQVDPLLRPDDRRILLVIDQCDAWPAAAGLAVDLERHGRHVTVDGAVCTWGRFTLYFGDNRARRGDESVELEWALANDPAHPGQAPVLAGRVLPGTFYNAAVSFRRLR